MWWDIYYDDFHRTHGIQSRFGGQVIVDNATALRVVGKDHILATGHSGNMYLINVNEWDSDDVQSFAIELEWLDTLKAAGVCAPTLRDRAALYELSIQAVTRRSTRWPCAQDAASGRRR
ncbi:hypothetical protein [Fontivita pretiosa]|uniref:hypothetical protein n=1 Tax=Fontivita pretiosa TaxID=2989684 RepID=UPI003D1810A9